MTERETKLWNESLRICGEWPRSVRSLAAERLKAKAEALWEAAKQVREKTDSIQWHPAELSCRWLERRAAEYSKAAEGGNG